MPGGGKFFPPLPGIFDTHIDDPGARERVTRAIARAERPCAQVIGIARRGPIRIDCRPATNMIVDFA